MPKAMEEEKLTHLAAWEESNKSSDTMMAS
jgi:hypothetical protein